MMSDIVKELREEAAFAASLPFAEEGGIPDLFSRAAARIEADAVELAETNEILAVRDRQISDLKIELAACEARQVGLTAEVDALKSKGPFVLDESNPHMVYCEDTGVYFNPSQPQGICDKLNTMQSQLAALKQRAEKAEKLIKSVRCCNFCQSHTAIGGGVINADGSALNWECHNPPCNCGTQDWKAQALTALAGGNDGK